MVEFFLVNCSLYFRDSLAYQWPSTQMFVRLRHAFLFPLGWGGGGDGGGGGGAGGVEALKERLRGRLAYQ